MRLGIALTAAASILAAQPRPAAPLALINGALHQYEDGPPVPSGYRVMPGETVFFSIQVKGFTVSADERVRLSYRVEAYDEGGLLLAEPGAGSIDAAVTVFDKEWLPKIRYAFLLPPHALPGRCRIVTRLRDELDGREASADTPLLVGGRMVELSGTLAVRNFRFLRREQDTQPMEAAVYRPGDALWAKFDITGFRSGEKNRVNVTYGLSVLGPSGKVLFSEPLAAADEDEPFYPKRYVSGAVNLSVQPKTPPGEYILVLTVRDEVGGQSIESRHPFRVE